MNSLAIPVAVLCCLALASVVLSFVALCCARSSARAAERRAQVGSDRMQATVASTGETVKHLETELHDLEEQLPLVTAPLPLRLGLNLGKRSQALRMHRRGETPEHIAISLGIPLQEVHLLLKVHRIVMSNL